MEISAKPLTKPLRENASLTCCHCSLKLPEKDRVFYSEKAFCCQGCKTVYQILNKNSLSDFYRLREREKQSSPTLKDRGRVDFQYMDVKDFVDQYFPLVDEQYRSGTFYVEGVHCHACLWLLEKIPQFLNSVKTSKFHFGRYELKVIVDKNFQFSLLGDYLYQLGYKISAIEANSSTQKLINRENKQWLYRIGVAATVMGNIMLFSVANYAGTEDHWRLLFDRISAILFFPVMTYSAFPLYRSAFGSIRTRQFSIDFPLVLAIVLGGILSYYHILVGSDQVYFDSLTTLIFLILSSRFFLRKVQQQNQLMIDREIPFTQTSVEVWDKDQKKWYPRNIDKIAVGDTIHWPKGEILPLDGTLTGQTIVDTALITGESQPIHKKDYDKVLSGTRNLKNDSSVCVQKIYSEGVMGKMMEELKGQWREYRPYQGLTDRLATYLFQVIFFAAGLLLVLFGWHQGIWEEGTSRALSLLIIACPCALGMGAPLIFSLALKNLFTQKIFVKSGKELEKLFNIQNIFFDKTGTLTLDELEVDVWEGKQDCITLSSVYALEELSRHPVARGLCSFIQNQKNLEVEDFKEVVATGVEGKVNNIFYQVGRFNPSQNNLESREVGVWREGQLIAKVSFKERLNPMAQKLIQWLKKESAKIFILTGDRASIATKKASELGINSEHVYSECLPEDKRKILRRFSPTVMVGDGINDSLALSYADVGIGIKGGLPLKIKDANINIEEGGLQNVFNLLKYVKKIKKTLYITLGFSLSFNLVGLILAMLGIINPLIAAILMPLSSLSVIGISYLGTREKIKKV